MSQSHTRVRTRKRHWFGLKQENKFKPSDICMIIQQHWFWQHGKNLGQDKIWVTQNTSSLCKTCLELTQLLQPMIQPSYAEFCLHPNYPSAPNTTVMCSQWQSQSCDMTKWPATVLISQLWFLTQSLADLHVAALLSFSWKPEKRKAHWLSRNPAPGFHVRTRAGAPWSFRKSNQIGCPAHCHTAPCHPPRPEVTFWGASGDIQILTFHMPRASRKRSSERETFHTGSVLKEGKYPV